MYAEGNNSGAFVTIRPVTFLNVPGTSGFSEINDPSASQASLWRHRGTQRGCGADKELPRQELPLRFPTKEAETRITYRVLVTVVWFYPNPEPVDEFLYGFTIQALMKIQKSIQLLSSCYTRGRRHGETNRHLFQLLVAKVLKSDWLLAVWPTFDSRKGTDYFLRHPAPYLVDSRHQMFGAWN